MLMEKHIKAGSCLMTDMPLKQQESEPPSEAEDQTDPTTTSNRRSCIDCHATSTPCWRGGPAGPRTLCNACGIRYRKRRRGILGIREENGVVVKESSKKKGKQLFLKEEWKRKRKMGEEERAAILLMALSCGGSTFA